MRCCFQKRSLFNKKTGLWVTLSRGTFFRLVVTSSRRMMSVTHSRKHSKNNMAFLFVFSLYQKYKDFFELKIERGGQGRERRVWSDVGEGKWPEVARTFSECVSSVCRGSSGRISSPMKKKLMEMYLCNYLEINYSLDEHKLKVKCDSEHVRSEINR